MKIALIANPCSGGKRGGKLIPVVKKKLKDRNIKFDIFITEYHQHALDIVKNLSVNDYDSVVSLGGDGTNYEVLNGLLKFHGKNNIPPLGIIPVGRGNSFARDLDIMTTDDGILALARQNTRPVDVCSFTQARERFYFVNMTGFGFVTDAARTAVGFKFLGDLSYIIGVLYRTIKLAFHKMELEIDGNIIGGKNCFVEFCNSRFTGGNMLIAPDAKIDDGFFDVVILGPLSRISMMCTFPKLFKGLHGQNPAFKFIRAKKATVYTTPSKVLLPDGEIFGKTPAKINIHPKLVRYFS